MGKQDGCIWLSACDAETLRRNGKGSKQKRAREARLLNTKVGGLPSIHALMEKNSFKSLSQRMDFSLQHKNM